MRTVSGRALAQLSAAVVMLAIADCGDDERAWIVPYGHGKLATFLSERMDFENCSRFHPVYSNDYSSFCLK